MIPRNLPMLTKDAIHGHWDVLIEHDPDRPQIVAKFGHSLEMVTFVWSDQTGHLIDSRINSTTTPYAACVRLIRSKLGAQA